MATRILSPLACRFPYYPSLLEVTNTNRRGIYWPTLVGFPPADSMVGNLKTKS